MGAASPQTDDLQVEGSSSHDDSLEAAAPVVVRRNAGLAALVAAPRRRSPSRTCGAPPGRRAAGLGAVSAVMAAIAVLYLANLVDARTPLLVADDLGVRIRLGHQWRGLPWDAVDRVVVQPRRGLVRDGRLMFAPHSLARALDGLDARAERAALNQKLYGAALAVPMGLTTRSAPLDALADELPRSRTAGPTSPSSCRSPLTSPMTRRWTSCRRSRPSSRPGSPTTGTTPMTPTTWTQSTQWTRRTPPAPTAPRVDGPAGTLARRRARREPVDEVEPAEQTEETQQVDEVAPEPYVEHVPEPPVEDWPNSSP